MRTTVLFTSVLVIVAAMLSVGFQCGSTEMTSAKLYIQQSKWDDAIKNLDTELAKNPNNEEAWYLLGRVKAEKNDLAGMVDAFNHALKVGQTHKKDIQDLTYGYWGKYMNSGAESFNKSKDTDLKTGLTKDEVAQRLGKPDTVNKTVTEFGASEQWVYTKLDLYLYFDENALKGWQEFNKSVSTNGETNVYLDRAINAFETAILLEPDSATAYRHLGFSYLAKNDVSSALGALEKSYAMSGDPVSGRYIGEIENDRGQRHRAKFESPENKIEIRIWMTPDQVKEKLGEPASKSTKKEKKVVKEKWVYADKKLTLNFEDGELRSWEENGKIEQKEPWVYYNSYAERDSAMKYFDRAITVLEKVSKDDPHNAEIIGLLSNVYIAADKGEAALDIFKKGVEADPKNKYFHYNYGVLLLNLTGSDSVKADTTGALANSLYERAIEQFEAAVTIDSTYESALYNLGATYLNWGVHIRESAHDPATVESVYKGKFKLGLPYLEEMTRLKPDDPEAWELVGKVYANLGRGKEATAVFEKVDKLRKK
jgi:tetratricopeptide (TPR) repeat protein